MTADLKVTPRQLDCLVNCYLGARWDSRRVKRGHGYRALYPSDDQIPALTDDQLVAIWNRVVSEDITI